MKAAVVVFSTLLAVVVSQAPNKDYLPPTTGGSGGSGPSGGGYGSGGGGGGGASSDDGPSAPANYEFSYEVKDPASGNDFGHMENRQGDVAKGKYFVLLPDGRKQIVVYTADKEGYKPEVTYEGEVKVTGPSGGGSGGSGPGAGGSSGGYRY